MFNALSLRPGGAGVSTYIRELLAALPAVVDADLSAVVQSDAVKELPDGVEAVVRPVADGWRRALVGMIPAREADLVHGLDVDLPLRPRVPTVTTVHDLSAFDVPWSYSRFHGVAERRLVSATVRRADAVIADSGFTGSRVKDRLGRDAVAVPLAPRRGLTCPGPDEVARVRAAYRLPSRFVLHVGDLGPRKDVDGLAAACRLAGVPLILAGNIRSGAIPGCARPLGFVAQDDLGGLYGAATVVAYPSRYEGFGLPPVEAMACGAPVVCTRIPAFEDILGDAAEIVAPGDVEGLASSLHALLVDDCRRQQLATAGHRRVAKLTWRATATATAEVYRSLGLRV
jgi:glycosyltransferase involved in cell wall biosynthesis